MTAAFTIDRPRTWKGRPGRAAVTSRGTGRRLVLHRWDDTGETTLREIKGDAWRRPADFVEYRSLDLGVTDSIEAAVVTAERYR